MEKEPLDGFRKIVNRIMDQLEYVRNLSDDPPRFPHHVHIEPTNACNLRCIHCVQESMTRPPCFLEWDVYTKVIDETGPAQTQITLDVQGEPMLHPRILDMVAYAKEAGCNVSLLTNATLLDNDKSSRLIEAGLDRIVFSFDAVEKELYEKIRQRARFEPTLANLLNFLRLNYMADSPVFVCVSIIKQQATLEHLADYKAYFDELPVNTVFVSPLLNMSGGSKAADEVVLPPVSEKYGNDSPVCRVPWENITVNADGSVCCCPLDYNVVWPAGWAKKSSLHEIWSGEAYRQFRRAHLNRDFQEVEKNGVLCSSCNCRFDPEYDIRRYDEFAREAIVRQAARYAPALANFQSSAPDSRERKYNMLLQRMAELEAEIND